MKDFRILYTLSPLDSSEFIFVSNQNVGYETEHINSRNTLKGVISH